MKPVIISVLCAFILLLSSCSGKQQPDNTKIDSFVNVTDSSSEALYTQNGNDSVAEKPSEAAEGSSDYIDMTTMKGDLAYSTVFDMMNSPESYIGKTVKMHGLFSAFLDENTGNQYFACIIPDATACCSQGIEFVWKGSHKWPDDYPALDGEITVEGIFETYYEDGNLYCHLTDASLSF